MLNKIALIIATFFGAGLSPKAPGTAGSFATLPLAFLIAYFYGRDGIILAAAISFFIGTWLNSDRSKSKSTNTYSSTPAWHMPNK